MYKTTFLIKKSFFIKTRFQKKFISHVFFETKQLNKFYSKNLKN